MTALLHRFSLPLRRYATSIFPSPFFSAPFSTIASSQLSISAASQPLQKLREIGIEERFINHLENAPESSLVESSCQKIHLLMAEGVSVHQLNHFLRKCGLQVDEYFLHPPLRRLVHTLAFFKSIHVEKQNLASIFVRDSSILRREVSRLERKFAILQSLGIVCEELGKIYVKRPRVFTLSEDTWQRRLEFWRKLGVSNESLCKMLRSQPQKICLSCDKYLEPLITHFENYGISRDVVARSLSRVPGCLGLSMETLARKMEFVQNLGFQKNSIQIMRAYCHLASYSLPVLQSRLDWLSNRGFSVDEVKHLVRRHPTILRKKTETTERTLDYLLNVWKLELKDILQFPECLGYSLENRIKPRFAVLAERGEHKLTRLSSVLHCTDAAFQKRYSITSTETTKE